MCAIIELRFLSWGSIRFRSTSAGQDTPSKLVPVRFWNLDRESRLEVYVKALD